jgi:nucleotide-binding universal stress UspA family protein
MAIQKTRKETRSKLEELCEVFEAEGISAREHVYVGDPDLEIEKAARDCQATLIVLGSSAKAAWVEKWLGSTPRDIAEKSVYPTLLIPPEKA